MQQTYLFETDNLGFRPFTPRDLNHVASLDADPETMSFFPGGVRTLEEIEQNIEKYINFYHKYHYGIFMVFDILSGEFF